MVLNGTEQVFGKRVATDDGQTVLNIELTEAELASIAGGDALIVADLFGTQIAGFRYPGAQRAVAQLRRCAREHANIDRGSGKPAATHPVLTSVQVSPDDYPIQSLRNGEEGRSLAHLTVSAKGRVSECSIKTSSGSELLDEATCLVLSRTARFTPAKDANGADTQDEYDRAIVWRVPED